MNKTVGSRMEKTILIRMSNQEHQQLKETAEIVRLPLSSFLRQVGLGYAPPSLTDLKSAIELGRLRGDLGRYGGLLKLWLTEQPNTSIHDHEVRDYLNQAAEVQEKIKKLADKLDQLLDEK